MGECKLRLNGKKTQIVYNKSARNRLKNNYPKKFDFLGFSFKPTLFPSKRGGAFLGTGCAISRKARRRIVDGWKKMNFHRNPTETIQSIAHKVNSQIRGIIQYYGKINLYSQYKLMKQFNPPSRSLRRTRSLV